MKRTSFKLPSIGIVLIWVMALVQATRYARAFTLNEAMQSGLTGITSIDDLLQWFGIFGGLFMGAGVSLGIAYVATRYKSMKAITKTGKEGIAITRVILIAMLIVSPFVLVPLKGIFSLDWWHQIVLMAIPDALVAALAFADNSMQSQDKLPSESLSKPSGRSAKGSRRSKSLSKSQSEIPCGFAGAGCERTFASQNAANAHARTCKFKPTIIYAEPEKVEKKT